MGNEHLREAFLRRKVWIFQKKSFPCVERVNFLEIFFPLVRGLNLSNNHFPGMKKLNISEQHLPVWRDSIIKKHLSNVKGLNISCLRDWIFQKTFSQISVYRVWRDWIYQKHVLGVRRLKISETYCNSTSFELFQLFHLWVSQLLGNQNFHLWVWNFSWRAW